MITVVIVATVEIWTPFYPPLQLQIKMSVHQELKEY